MIKVERLTRFVLSSSAQALDLRQWMGEQGIDYVYSAHYSHTSPVTIEIATKDDAAVCAYLGIEPTEEGA